MPDLKWEEVRGLMGEVQELFAGREVSEKEESADVGSSEAEHPASPLLPCDHKSSDDYTYAEGVV